MTGYFVKLITVILMVDSDGNNLSLVGQVVKSSLGNLFVPTKPLRPIFQTELRELCVS